MILAHFIQQCLKINTKRISLKKNMKKKKAENLCANLTYIKGNLSETTINVDEADNARQNIFLITWLELLKNSFCFRKTSFFTLNL